MSLLDNRTPLQGATPPWVPLRRVPRLGGHSDTMGHLRVTTPSDPAQQYSRDATSPAHIHRVHDRVRRRLGDPLARRRDRGFTPHVPHGPHRLRGMGDWLDVGDDRQMGLPASESSAVGLAHRNRLAVFPQVGAVRAASQRSRLCPRWGRRARTSGVRAVAQAGVISQDQKSDGIDPWN